MTARFIKAGSLAQLSGVRHGFFTREHGHSTGIHAGLNCGLGSRDDPATVAANRAEVAAALGYPGSPLLTVHQVHSAVAVTADAPFAGPAPQADALVTSIPDLVIGVLAADCAPVLFASRDGAVIGAAHAGWKGALGGIVESTVEAMEATGARRGDIAAAIGPCIAQASYEVGPEFREAVTAGEPAAAGLFRPSDRAGHFRFDLPGLVVLRLVQSGIETIDVLNCDTYADEARFYSYRRATHRNQSDYGRQASAIVIGPRGQH